MLGWTISIHRGGTIVTQGSSVEIQGSEILLQTDPIPDPRIIDSLYADEIADQVKTYGNGYPYVWQLPAGALSSLLEALDNRRPRSYSNRSLISKIVHQHNIPDNELIYVEAWDQS